jgi:uncharacterized protein YbjQ (UPF0145 family)
MAQDKKQCPTCGKPLGDRVVMLTEPMIELLRMHAPQENYVLCTKCGGAKLYSASTRLSTTEVSAQIASLHASIPIVSSQTPPGWDFRTLRIVTAQSVIGTGVLSEFSASLGDLFGKISPAFVSKIVQGEESCCAQLVQKTLALGGNAVLAVDIDYAELGSLKGMIMVCMTGTAVSLRNVEVLGTETAKNIGTLKEKLAELSHLNQLYEEYRQFAHNYL